MEKQDYEAITRCLRWLANAVINDYMDKSTSSLLNDKIEKFYHTVNNKIDWYNLQPKDFRALGFMSYGENEETDVWLIPAWMYGIVPDGLTVENIYGHSGAFNKIDFPYETFYGNLNFGIRVAPKELVGTDEEDYD